MKARLGLLLLICVSATAVGQMTLSGGWSTTVSLLPTIGATTELSLRGEFGGWTVEGSAEFLNADGYVWQTVGVGGTFGPGEVTWTFLFGPKAPAFLYTLGRGRVTVAGIELTVYTAYVGPTIPGYFFSGGPSGGAVAVAAVDIGGVKFSSAVGFGARLTDFTITYTGVGTHTKTFPVDPFPGGLQFTYLELDLEGIPLCCGITFDTEFSFTKAGFDSIGFTLKEIPISLGITLDTVVTFTTTSKTVEIVPQWGGIEGCLAVYGDAMFANNVWQGIEIYGFKVRCELADCNYLEILTAFNVARLEYILDEDLFQGTEFQYLRLGFCGPGCCGEKYTLELTTYFQPMGSLFGIRRLTAEAGIPIMANLTAHLDLGVTVGGPVALAVGWTFTF